MVERSEVVSLVLAIIFVVSIVFLHRARRLPRLSLIYAGAGLMVAANFFTVAEGLVWEAGLNAAEHGCYAAAGLCFAIGCWRFPAASEEDGEEG
ncbi:MAG: hypothetical protein ACLF0G_04170 [Candidatus Brocadiia bacterium]